MTSLAIQLCNEISNKEFAKFAFVYYMLGQTMFVN